MPLAATKIRLKRVEENSIKNLAFFSAWTNCGAAQFLTCGHVAMLDLHR